MTKPTLFIDDLHCAYPVRKGFSTQWLRAVDGLTLSIQPGETVGLVGESGCGKSTLARTILALETPRSGNIFFEGDNITSADKRTAKNARQQIKMVFQDPFASLNPRHSIRRILEEPLLITGYERNRQKRIEMIEQTLELVGLRKDYINRYPHELSGGQPQRVGIARAILPTPKMIIADEPVAALDVSIQAQILDQFQSLREQMGLAMLFISHDLSVVRHLCDRIAVMYFGRLVEIGDSDEVFNNPQHPYTQRLLDALPKPDPSVQFQRSQDSAELPNPLEKLTGCAFSPRCRFVTDRCQQETPLLTINPEQTTSQRMVACHHR